MIQLQLQKQPNGIQPNLLLRHLFLLLELELISNLKINFAITPQPNDITGIFNFPYPCNAPFIVWSKIVKIIVHELICKIVVPLLALGNNNCNIGPAKIHIPIVHGNPISIETNSENDVFCDIVFLSFLAFAADIAGTNAVEKATFIDNGKLVSVSTFPPKIPYCVIAISSGINCFKLLTTVKESIFLFKDDIIAVNAIGTETIKIFFIIVLTLSYL